MHALKEKWRPLRAEAGRLFRTYRYVFTALRPRPEFDFDCVFVVGHFKTGTTSTAQFLQSLGLRHLTQNEHVMAARSRGDYAYLDRLSSRFNSFDDHPWNRLDVVSHFMAQRRDFRFILTDRDPGEWFDSLVRFAISRNLKVPIEADRNRFVEERFLAHNAEIERLAEQNGHRLLKIDVTKDRFSAEKIAGFLDVEVRPLPTFPHLNRTK